MSKVWDECGKPVKIAKVTWYDTMLSDQTRTGDFATTPERLVAYGEIVEDNSVAICLKAGYSLGVATALEDGIEPLDVLTLVFTIPKKAIIEIRYLTVQRRIKGAAI